MTFRRALRLRGLRRSASGTTGSRTARAGFGAALVAVVVAASGCGLNPQALPLPGGVDLGDNPRTYKVEFSNILDLVPQSVVKMDGTPVGRVTKIEVPQDSWNAVVEIKVQNRVDLSDEAFVSIQQTNLLGEKFVALSEPENSESLPRQNPSQVIPIQGTDGEQRTRTTTDIEQLLGALSLLLNGGGINQLEPIITAINTATSTGDQPSNVRALLKSADTLIAGLNEQRDNILDAIDGVAALSERAAGQTTQIDRILKELPAGVQVLEEQRPQFVDLLTKLDALGDAGTAVLNKAHKQMINDLKALKPILTELANSADDAITAFPLMLTHPYPDDLLPGVHGDSTNLFMTVDLRLLNQLEALGVGQGNPQYRAPSVHAPKINPRNPYTNGNGPRYGWPTITLLPPGPNWRIGPNTPPPPGGTYPMNPVPQKKKKKSSSSTTTKKPASTTKGAKKPASAGLTTDPGDGYMNEVVRVIGGDDAQ